MRRLSKTLVVMLLFVPAPASAVAGPGGLSWTAPQVIDHGPPFGSGHAIGAASCPGKSLCLAVDGPNVLSSNDPTGSRTAWSLAEVDPQAASMQAISCPSMKLCVAVDASGNVVSSKDPTGGAGAWHLVHVDNDQLTSVSCPSVTLCVAIDDAGNALASRNPGGGASAWQRTQIDRTGHGGSISCPTTGLCVAEEIVSNPALVPDDIVSTTDPTGTTAAWHAVKAPPGIRFALSCPSARLCVGAGEGPSANGVVVVSTEPTGDTTAWRESTVPETSAFTSVTCSSTRLCLVGYAGVVGTTADPVSGSWGFKTLERGGQQVQGLACHSTSLCVATDDQGRIFRATQPTGAWRSAWVDGQNALVGLACPSSSACIAFDDAGKVLTSTEPDRGPSAWKVVPGLHITPNLEGFSATAAHDVACPSASLCLTAEGGQILTSTKPFARPPRWTATDVPATEIDALSCPSIKLCVAIDNETTDNSNFVNVLASTNPARGAWRTTAPMLSQPAIDFGAAVSCASQALCAIGGEGTIAASSNALGGPLAWQLATPTQQPVDSISCPSKSLCVGLDHLGTLLVSSHPVRGPWTGRTLSGRTHISYVTCPSTSLCVAAGNGILISTALTGAAKGWSAARIPGYRGQVFTTVSCASTSFCVAAGGEAIVMGTRRTHR